MATRGAHSLADNERFVVRTSWTGLLNGRASVTPKFGPFADRPVRAAGR
jgi:hypothetical protein